MDSISVDKRVFKTTDISNSWFYVEDQENGKYIISDGKVLKTPAGKIIESSNKRLLKHIAEELNALDTLDPHDFNTYSIYCIQ